MIQNKLSKAFHKLLVFTHFTEIELKKRNGHLNARAAHAVSPPSIVYSACRGFPSLMSYAISLEKKNSNASVKTRKLGEQELLPCKDVYYSELHIS